MFPEFRTDTELDSFRTFGDMVKANTPPGSSYDTALPMEWAKAQRAKGITVYGHFVWMYDFGPCEGAPRHGVPYPVSVYGRAIAHMLGAK